MIISIINQKGGVGKTTTTQNIGSALTKLGKKVLLVDLDPQGSLGISEGIDLISLEYTMSNVLEKEVGIEEILVETNGMHLAPSRIDLAQAELRMVSEFGREQILKARLKSIKDVYDYILIDCPPNLSILTINALTTSQKIIVPVASDFLSIMALELLFETVKNVKERINDQLEVDSIVTTMIDTRTNHSRKAYKEIKDTYKDKHKLYRIPRTVKIKDSILDMDSMVNLYPEHKASKEYMKIAESIINNK
jgi:chromosome partitioning protein